METGFHAVMGRDSVKAMICRIVLTTVLLGGTAYAQCDDQNLVTTGATGARSATSGKSLITMEAVGGVEVVGRGSQGGGFAVQTQCEPRRAQALRQRLQGAAGQQ